MNIDQIEQEAIAETDMILTTVVISSVTSQCVLARQLIDVLGRPGIDNDMELMGSGDQWVICWTKPYLSLNETKVLVNQALNPNLRTI